MWVPAFEGQIVGFASTGPPREQPPVSDLELGNIYLLAAHHGSGLGQELLDVVLGGRGASLWVLDDNPRAQAFYTRNGALPTSSELASWNDDRMENSQLSGLSVFASGVWPVEISAGKRINAVHRVPVRASVDVTTGEVRFHVDSEGIDILRRDSDQR